MTIGHTDCDAPVGIVVHRDRQPDVRLPIIGEGITLSERKQGPTAFTRLAEVTVPIEGFGSDDWLQYISDFTPTPSEADRLPQRFQGVPLRPESGPIGEPQSAIAETPQGEVEIDSEARLVGAGPQLASVLAAPLGDNGQRVGDLRRVFTGYIAAVGSSPGVNRARFRVVDPASLLSRIEAGASFNNPTVEDVLRYIVRTLRDKSPFDRATYDVGDGVGASPFTDADAVDGAELSRVEGTSGETSTLQTAVGIETAPTAETFSTARDTLADVLTWLQEVSSARCWFEPAADGATIRLVADTPTSNTWDLTPSSSAPPRVIDNNALYEIRPLNGLKVQGKPGVNIEILGSRFTTPFGSEYFVTTATYDPLVERYGGTLLETITVDYNRAEPLTRVARQKLKQRLDEVSGGGIRTTFAPFLRPYERVLLTPACNGVGADVAPLPYEIQSARHKLVPNPDAEGGQYLPHTELEVGMAVDPEEISVTTPTKKTARTQSKPTNEERYSNIEYGTQ